MMEGFVWQIKLTFVFLIVGKVYPEFLLYGYIQEQYI